VISKQVQNGKSLIVGASGQVGSALVALLGKENCVGTARDDRTTGHTLDLGNLTRDPSKAIGLLRAHEIGAIYCAGGMTNVDVCELDPELTFSVNCSGPATLAALAAERNLPMAYFSTDYVFDGESGPYTEADDPRPISVYGKSKHKGEMEVGKAHPGALIVRTTVIYGPDPRRKNSVYSLWRALTSNQTFRVPDDQISTPTYNRDLASAVVQLLDSGVSGIVHVAGPACLSRTAFAKRVATATGLDPDRIIGLPTAQLGQCAPRPLKGGLLIGRLRKLLPMVHMRNIEEAIEHWRSGDGLMDVP